MHTFYEILQTPNREGETTIVFFTNGKRYLFNASENLHRFCTECGVRVFSGLEHVFIPHISPSYLGGLPGAIITASETSTTNKFHLYGPPNLWHYLTSLRQFVKTPISFKIMLNMMMEHQVEEDYLMHKDENISVRGILLKGENVSRREDYHKLLPYCDFGGPFALRNSSGNFIKQSNEKGMAWDFLFQNKHRKGQDLSPSKKKLKKESEEFYYSFKNRLNIQPMGELNANQGHVDTLREMLKYINPTLNDYCMCFVCKTADVPGKFDSNKATELGVFGMMRGKLAKGETIVINGATIKPEDVIDPPTPGSEVLIINCPNESYLKSLVTHKQFEKYYSKAASVIHCVSHEILVTPLYQEFMKRFSQECDHVIVNEDSSKPASSFVSSCTNIVEFSLVDKDLFTLCLNPNHNQNSEAHQKSLKSLHSNSKITYGESLMKYVLIPTRNKGFDVSKVPYIREIVPSSVESNFYQSYPSIAKYLREYLDKFSNCEYALNETHPQAKILQQCGDEEFEIIFLGTGSSVPSKYRNVTGILLNLFDKGAILFDCGEGTLSQLYRACGKERAESILKNLKCIWISHLHADHHLGLAYLLEKRSKLTSEDVVIVGQGRIKEALSEYLVCSSDTKFNFDFIPMQTLEPERYCPEKILIDRVINPLGLKSFVNVPVDHTCAEAYGIVITHQNGWKVVFSGDTRPCSRLIKAGKDCTVLIHEATFEASMIKDAISKKHTCSFEAISVGEQMNAYRTILTHFSQRYCKFPIVDSQKTDYALKNVAVAHDLMRLNAKKLIPIPRVMQILKHFWTIIEMDTQSYSFDFDEVDEDEAEKK